MRRLARILCLALLGLVLFDGAADLAGCHNENQATATACHACACGPHIAPQTSSTIVDMPRPATYVPYKADKYAFLLVESFFQPPKLAA
jgi:hypothetical protein